jgi:polysaccharide export outer membrane protein
MSVTINVISRKRTLRAKLVLASILAFLICSSWAGAQTLQEYRLQPGDQIEVSIWGEEELQRIVMLRPDGKFAFPLAGEIDAAGRTPADIKAELTRKLLIYVPEASVTVSVTGIDGNRIYVIGQVKNPGSFVISRSINVLKALSLAGGTTPFAELNDIVILRGSGPDQRVFRFAYNDVTKGKKLEQNIQLESGDVVIVP